MDSGKPLRWCLHCGYLVWLDPCGVWRHMWNDDARCYSGVIGDASRLAPPDTRAVPR